MSAQAKVLRVLQENKITRVGGNNDIEVDVRVVAATNKDLVKEIDNGHFRLDLYHRLTVILIHVPSLNERSEDIPLLAQKFLQDICSDYGITEKTYSKKALQALQDINWTGNIRELRNVVERLVILSEDEITEEDVVTYVGAGQIKATDLTGNLDNLFDEFVKFQDFKGFIEGKFIEYKLKKNNWNISKTAEQLDIQRSHLYNKIEKFDLQRAT